VLAVAASSYFAVTMPVHQAVQHLEQRPTPQ